MEYSGDEFDVIVVGAGIMGSSTAYQLAKRGQKTLLVEQFDFLHPRGSSHGDSRFIRATYPEDYYQDMVLESSLLWEEAQQQIGYNVYLKSQHLDMGPSDSKKLLSVIATCQKNGLPYQLLQPREVAEKYPGWLDIPENWVGLYIGLGVGGVIKSTKAVSMFQTLAFQEGVTLRDNMEVKNIVKDEVKGGVVVVTTNGDKFWGKKCVVTAGAWMRKLVKTVSGLELPIQPSEVMVCYWRIKEGHEAEFAMGGDFPTFTYSFGDSYIYGLPSFEYPGVIKISLHGGYPCDPDNRAWGSGITMESLKQWIKSSFKGLIDFNSPVSTHSCMYSMTPDEDFVIDFLGGEFGKDVVIGCGFSGHGFKMAPVVGRLLADLAITGEASGVDLKHFRIGRFEDNPKGNVKDY